MRDTRFARLLFLRIVHVSHSIDAVDVFLILYQFTQHPTYIDPVQVQSTRMGQR